MNFSGIYKNALVSLLNCESLQLDHFANLLKVTRGFPRKGFATVRHGALAPMPLAAVAMDVKWPSLTPSLDLLHLLPPVSRIEFDPI